MSFGGERIGFEQPTLAAATPVVVFDRAIELPLMPIGGMDLRASRENRREKGDARRNPRYIKRPDANASKQTPRGPKGGHQQPGSSGPRPH